MSCSVTSVFTFKIESTFDEWAAIFDSAEADKRHSEFDIKPLFRGVSKEDTQIIIVIHQAPEGNVQKFVEAKVTGWQLIELTYQQWRNHLGLLHYQRKIVVINN